MEEGRQRLHPGDHTGSRAAEQGTVERPRRALLEGARSDRPQPLPEAPTVLECAGEVVSARLHEENVGVATRQGIPVRLQRPAAGLSHEAESPRRGDHLRHPVAGKEGGIEPLE